MCCLVLDVAMVGFGRDWSLDEVMETKLVGIHEIGTMFAILNLDHRAVVGLLLKLWNGMYS